MNIDFTKWDFDQAPLVVIWELTRACALACKHCRAEAVTRRDPRELSFAEGCQLMDQVKAFGSPVLVLTGGDPLMRPDFFDLVRYGSSIGLRVSASPSGTKLVTREAMEKAAAAGLRRVQFSLDGALPQTHDGFRGVKGSFQWTMDGMRYVKEAGMELQIGTTVSRYSIGELEQIAEIAERVGCTLWSLFFLVPVGRGQTADMVSPAEAERVLHWLYDLTGKAPFAIKATEAPFFRRVARQRSGVSPAVTPPAGLRVSLAPGVAAPGRIASVGVNDGKGFLFVDHVGDVYPSGFLPLSAGSVREHPLGWLYRESDLFRELRNPDLLKGKCGVCEYRRICGGSRSRAYAITGDYLESDPQCVYMPG
jgi:radical SAM protein